MEFKNFSDFFEDLVKEVKAKKYVTIIDSLDKTSNCDYEKDEDEDVVLYHVIPFCDLSSIQKHLMYLKRAGDLDDSLDTSGFEPSLDYVFDDDDLYTRLSVKLD